MLDDIKWTLLKRRHMPYLQATEFTAAMIGTPLKHPGHKDLFYTISQRKLEEVRILLEDVRAELGSLIGCDQRNVVFDNTTTSAFDHAMGTLKLEEGDEIITTTREYDTIPRILELYSARKGTKILTVDTENIIDNIVHALSPKTRLIVTSYITHLSELLPVQDIGIVAKMHGITYIVDAAQAAGHIPLKAGEINADIIVSCGHKWLRTTPTAAFAYYAPGRTLPQHTHSTPFDTSAPDMEEAYWFVDYDGWGNSGRILELGSNLRTFRRTGWDEIHGRIQMLGEQAHEMLQANPSVDVLSHAAGMTTFRVKGLKQDDIRKALEAQDIVVTYKEHNDSLRIATSQYNTSWDIENLNRALKQIARKHDI